MNKIIINQSKLNSVQKSLEALADPVRLRIIKIIDDLGTSIISEVLKIMKMEQSNMSYHIRLLSEAGIISVERKGKYGVCKLNYPYLERLSKAKL